MERGCGFIWILSILRITFFSLTSFPQGLRFSSLNQVGKVGQGKNTVPYSIFYDDTVCHFIYSCHKIHTSISILNHCWNIWSNYMLELQGQKNHENSNYLKKYDHMASYNTNSHNIQCTKLKT